MTSDPYFNPIQTSLKPSSTGFSIPFPNPFFPTPLESFPFPTRRYIWEINRLRVPADKCSMYDGAFPFFLETILELTLECAVKEGWGIAIDLS